MNQFSIMLDSNSSLKPNTSKMFVDIVGIAINRDVITHEFALNRASVGERRFSTTLYAFPFQLEVYRVARRQHEDVSL